MTAVTFESQSGLPGDRCVHTMAWRFEVGQPLTANFDDLQAQLVGFYTATSGVQNNAMGVYLSGRLSRDMPPVLDIYKCQPTGTPLGSPVYTSDLLVLPEPGAASNLPAEVAVRLSVNADLTGIPEEDGTERPRGSRRGGFYFGPLSAVIADGGADDEPGVDSSFRLDAKIAMQDLHENAGLAGWTWSIWSRDDNELYAVVNGRIDNAFDTQKRRGPKPTNGTVFPLPA